MENKAKDKINYVIIFSGTPDLETMTSKVLFLGLSDRGYEWYGSAKDLHNAILFNTKEEADQVIKSNKLKNCFSYGIM